MTQITSTAPPELEGVTHRFVDVNGVTLHIAEAGSEHHGGEKPSLFLVHGWPQHWWCWRHVIGLLAQTHHVVAVDLRGHGWSDAPAPGGAAYDKRTLADELVELTRILELDRPVWIGHDWGAWTSLLAAGRHTDQVRGVVATAIVAPWTPIPWYDLWRFGYQLVAGGPIGNLAHRSFGQVFLKLVFKLGSSPKFRWRKSDREVYLERWRHKDRAAAGVAVYRRFLLTELRASLRRDYQKPVTDVPLLFLPGRSDVVLAPRIVRRAEGLANVEFHEIASTGHWVPEEQPEVLAEQVSAFLNRL